MSHQSIFLARYSTKPLIMEGFIESEPTRYIAEMPYDLAYESGHHKSLMLTEMCLEDLFAGATITDLIVLPSLSIAIPREEYGIHEVFHSGSKPFSLMIA